MFYNFWRLAFTTQTFRVLHKPNFLTQLQKTQEDNKMEKQPVPKSPPQPCKLDMRVHEFISLICNIDMMQNMMTEIGYDARKMPLGKLSKSTILKVARYQYCGLMPCFDLLLSAELLACTVKLK
jgi:hypothetical protein